MLKLDDKVLIRVGDLQAAIETAHLANNLAEAMIQGEKIDLVTAFLAVATVTAVVIVLQASLDEAKAEAEKAANRGPYESPASSN